MLDLRVRVLVQPSACLSILPVSPVPGESAVPLRWLGQVCVLVVVLVLLVLVSADGGGAVFGEWALSALLDGLLADTTRQQGS
ncbi:hypothetical protein RM844_19685 [Streptomyces sp. DSM 44915]|uniref:Uncharacterized protein n=1 Tax=Streptomyces chisholmiae TaxID=3075540 RepID=A0ABU2JU45_9ACTN|nr:hypothetical protein [Streptomyces sp. DSM 44915]MDT0268511.1 hypothetical protein [Streptomyces sp. DSM 44915]